MVMMMMAERHCQWLRGEKENVQNSSNNDGSSYRGPSLLYRLCNNEQESKIIREQ